MKKLIIAVLLASAPVAAVARGHGGGYHWPTHSGWHHRLVDDEGEEQPQRSDDGHPIYDKDGHYRGYEDSHGQIYDEHGNYNGYEYGKA